MSVYERLYYMALGGRKEYRHNRGENKQTTKLQDFLDDATVTIRELHKEDNEKNQKIIKGLNIWQKDVRHLVK